MKTVTVVTGATGGMGYAISVAMARQGNTVLLCGRNEKKLQAAVNTMHQQNMDAQYIVMDMNSREQVQAAAELAASIGQVKHVIHTAGVSPIQVSHLDAPAGAAQIMDVNAMGTVYMVESFYPIMAEGGVFIGFTSAAIYLRPVVPENALAIFNSVLTDRENLQAQLNTLTFHNPGAAYMFSKLFVRHYCQMNVNRFGHKNCRILTLAPGRVLTQMHQALIDAEPSRIPEEMASMPLGRYGYAYEIANLVEFLCSYQASYLSGIDILMDAGTQAVTSIPQFDD